MLVVLFLQLSVMLPRGSNSFSSFSSQRLWRSVPHWSIATLIDGKSADVLVLKPVDKAAHCPKLGARPLTLTMGSIQSNVVILSYLSQSASDSCVDQFQLDLCFGLQRRFYKSWSVSLRRFWTLLFLWPATFQKNAIGALKYKTCEKISIGSSTAEEQTALGQVVEGSNLPNYHALFSSFYFSITLFQNGWSFRTIWYCELGHRS